MKRHQGARRHDQAAVGCMREGGDRALDLARVAHVDWAQLYPERRRNDWMAPNWPVPEAMAASRRIAARVTPGAISLSSSTHFALMPYSNKTKPVALPPGRVRLSTKPAPTGSTACANTMGTVRVAICNAATVGLAVARMT